MTMTNKPNPPGHGNVRATVAQLVQEASRALSLNQLQSAEQLLDRALEKAPHNAEAHRLLGIAALMMGNHAKAIGNLRSALTQCPNDAAINMTLGSVLFETGATEDGLAHLSRACGLAPEDGEAWFNFGVALEFACFELKITTKLEQARDAFEHTVSINPGHLKARNKLATVMMSMGDTQAAVRIVRDTLNRQPDCVDAWVLLVGLKTERLSNDDVKQLKHLLGRRDMADELRIPLGFTLAKALEDQFDYAAAFDTVSEANAMKHRNTPWNRNTERARVDDIARAFARPLATCADSSLGEGLIFVVCLPRSGATLTEQILASHPQVQGGGETMFLIDILVEESDCRGQAFSQWVTTATREDWRRLGETYLERTSRLRAQHPRFTDKSVDNWAFAGAALAMLPGARVVNSRRNPLETCFACYRQLFPAGGRFTYNLDDMVDYYAGYERLSALWQQQFPQRYFDHSYESLQKDTEGQIRRLLNFCDLAFDPACLAFYESRRTVLTMSSSQVREPVRQNTARGPLYGTRLDPLRAKLRAAGVSMADEFTVSGTATT